jgi:hypothetical protein
VICVGGIAAGSGGGEAACWWVVLGGCGGVGMLPFCVKDARGVWMIAKHGALYAVDGPPP